MSHEYRITFTIPLSGTDRQQSVLKAKIAPLIDEMEKQIVALEMKPTIADTTVRLKAKAETYSGPLTNAGILTGQSPLVGIASGMTAAEGAHHAKEMRRGEADGLTGEQISRTASRAASA